ncbi:MAG: tetratricopeptide repeat protein [archaeon]
MKNGILFHLAIIIILGTIVYANSFGNQFIWDDEFLIQKNIYIRDWKYLPRIFASNTRSGFLEQDNFYRPIHLSLYLVIYQLSGLHTFGYHLANLVLHLANSCLIYCLTLILFRKRAMSLITAALFTVHPIHTEAITYINGTADPLGLIFTLGSLIMFIKSLRHGSWTRVALISGSVLMFAMALLSKETTVVLPLIVSLILLYSNRYGVVQLVKKTWHIQLPYYVTAAAYAGLRLTVLNFLNILNFYGTENIYTENLHFRLYTFARALLTYYRLLFLPTGLHHERSLPVFISPFSIWIISSALILIAVICLAIWSYRRDRIIFFGILWFYITLIPVSGIIPANAIILEHWLYFPSVGFFLVVSYIITRLPKRQMRIAYLILIMALVLFSVQTIRRNTEWHDPIVFYRSTLRYSPDSARIHNNLGMAYADKGMYSQAIAEYSIATSLSDVYPQTHNNLANAYLSLGQIDNALQEYSIAVRMNPDFLVGHAGLAKIYQMKGMYTDYLRELEKIEEIKAKYLTD